MTTTKMRRLIAARNKCDNVIKCLSEEIDWNDCLDDAGLREVLGGCRDQLQKSVNEITEVLQTEKEEMKL